MAQIAMESGHYYTKSGEPAYTIIGKNGTERPTTIRDARSLGLVPSVTEVLKILPKPALQTWIQRQVLLASLTLPRQPDWDEETYIAKIIEDANEQARVARERGTAIHGAIEKFLLGMYNEDKELEEVACKVLNIVANHFNSYLDEFIKSCQTEKSFAYQAKNGLWYGGKVDLHSKELNFVLDFKTKEMVNTGKKMQWDEHIFQLCAYAKGLHFETNNVRLINVFVQTKEPYDIEIVECDGFSDWHWQVFLKTLELWYILKYFK